MDKGKEQQESGRTDYPTEGSNLEMINSNESGSTVVSGENIKKVRMRILIRIVDEEPHLMPY